MALQVVDYARMKRIALPEEKEGVSKWILVIFVFVIIFLFKRFRDCQLKKVSSSSSESP